MIAPELAAARRASQDDPSSGVDPYNTLDAYNRQRQIEADFAEFVATFKPQTTKEIRNGA